MSKDSIDKLPRKDQEDVKQDQMAPAQRVTSSGKDNRPDDGADRKVDPPVDTPSPPDNRDGKHDRDNKQTTPDSAVNHLLDSLVNHRPNGTTLLGSYGSNLPIEKTYAGLGGSAPVRVLAEETEHTSQHVYEPTIPTQRESKTAIINDLEISVEDRFWGKVFPGVVLTPTFTNIDLKETKKPLDVRTSALIGCPMSFPFQPLRGGFVPGERAFAGVETFLVQSTVVPSDPDIIELRECAVCFLPINHNSSRCDNCTTPQTIESLMSPAFQMLASPLSIMTGAVWPSMVQPTPSIEEIIHPAILTDCRFKPQLKGFTTGIVDASDEHHEEIIELKSDTGGPKKLRVNKTFCLSFLKHPDAIKEAFMTMFTGMQQFGLDYDKMQEYVKSNSPEPPTAQTKALLDYITFLRRYNSTPINPATLATDIKNAYTRLMSDPADDYVLYTHTPNASPISARKIRVLMSDEENEFIARETTRLEMLFDVIRASVGNVNTVLTMFSKQNRQIFTPLRESEVTYRLPYFVIDPELPYERPDVLKTSSEEFNKVFSSLFDTKAQPQSSVIQGADSAIAGTLQATSFYQAITAPPCVAFMTSILFGGKTTFTHNGVAGVTGFQDWLSASRGSHIVLISWIISMGCQFGLTAPENLIDSDGVSDTYFSQNLNDVGNPNGGTQVTNLAGPIPRPTYDQPYSIKSCRVRQVIYALAESLRGGFNDLSDGKSGRGRETNNRSPHKTFEMALDFYLIVRYLLQPVTINIPIGPGWSRSTTQPMSTFPNTLDHNFTQFGRDIQLPLLYGWGLSGPISTRGGHWHEVVRVPPNLDATSPIIQRLVTVYDEVVSRFILAVTYTRRSKDVSQSNIIPEQFQLRRLQFGYAIAAFLANCPSNPINFLPQRELVANCVNAIGSDVQIREAGFVTFLNPNLFGTGLTTNMSLTGREVLMVDPQPFLRPSLPLTLDEKGVEVYSPFMIDVYLLTFFRAFVVHVDVVRHYERIQLNKHHAKIEDFYANFYKDMVFFFESITPFFHTYSTQLKAATSLLFDHYRRYLALTRGRFGQTYLEFNQFLTTFVAFLTSGLLAQAPAPDLTDYINNILAVCSIYEPVAIPNFAAEAIQIFETPHDMNQTLRLPELLGQVALARGRFEDQNLQNVFEVGGQFSTAGMDPDITIESQAIVRGFTSITSMAPGSMVKRFPVVKLGSGHVIVDPSTDKERSFSPLPALLVDFLVDRVFNYDKSKFQALADLVDGDNPFISLVTNTTFTSGRGVVSLDHIIAACNYLFFRESFLVSPLSLRNLSFGVELNPPLILKVFSVNALKETVSDNSRLTLYYDNRVKNTLSLVVMHQTLHYNHDVKKRRFHSPISRTDVMPIISENVLTTTDGYRISVHRPHLVDMPLGQNNTTIVANRNMVAREVHNVAFFMCSESHAIDLPLRLAYA